ncbi:hypothetical protein J4214_05660 [Candidatus Woesearchaeota archaeon]|nr:hypothetical protein [Candidatus Woesearchaeota archaeon]
MSYSYVIYLVFRDLEDYENKLHKFKTALKKIGIRKWNDLSEENKKIYHSDYDKTFHYVNLYRIKYEDLIKFVPIGKHTAFSKVLIQFRGKLDKYYANKPTISLWIDDFIIEEDDVSNLKIFYELAKTICLEVDPHIALTGLTEDNQINAKLEYYYDLYNFCLKCEDISEIFTKENQELIKKIKKILPKEKLLNILKKYSIEFFSGGEGFGVIKGKKGSEIIDHYGYVWFPRYFVRREVRKLGIELDYDNFVDKLPEKFKEVQ